VSTRLLPDTTSVSWTLVSSARVMAPPDAVNGPMVPAGDGSVSATPVEGTGDGRGALKVIVPLGIDVGVAPVASTVAVALPMMALLPRAAAADAMLVGMVSVV
jgi:hypothetical protein